MKIERENTVAVWATEGQRHQYPTLEDDVEADVCIIGGGIAGLTTAHRLLLAGQSVVVLESREIGAGQTSRTSAHLSAILDDRFYKFEELHSADAAKLAYESHKVAIKTIEATVKQENIDCDFERVPAYLFADAATSREDLEKERLAAKRAGVETVKWLDATVPGFKVGEMLCFPNQAQFHPIKYLKGLAQAIDVKGGQIFEDSHAMSIQNDGKQATITVRCGTRGDTHKVLAKHVVIATNSPINDRMVIHTKQSAHRTYVIACRIPRGSVSKALYWDTADPYHYVRVVPEEPIEGQEFDLLIVGGEDHRTGESHDAKERYDALAKWAQEHFATPQLVVSEWSGQVLETLDGLAHIGRNPSDYDNVYVITGDSGMGLTHGTLGAMILTDLILGQPNPWSELYDPSRLPGKALADYALETLTTMSHYGRWLTTGESEDDLGLDAGVIVRESLKPVALYRDPSGTVHKMSAVCPHMGGIVSWNHSEKTWECACHGSCFDAKGRVIAGPANEDLKVLSDEEHEELVPTLSGFSLGQAPSLT